MHEKRPRLFYGWWVVLTCALGLFLGPIPTFFFSFAVFLKPFVREFHAGRGAVSIALTLATISLAVFVPIAGRLIDRFGARKVILPANLLGGLLFLAAYFCSDKIWQLYVLYLLLGIVGAGVAPVSYCYVISHWFDRHRGLALGLTMAGLGMGAFVMPSATQYLIARFGWRLTFGIVGASILIITVPVLTRFLVEKPEAMGLMPDGVLYPAGTSLRPANNVGMALRDALRTPAFWLLLCSIVLVSASVQACFAHIAAILADRGASAKAAALAASTFGAGLLAGRSGSGYLLDRFLAPRVAAVIFACAAAGIGLLCVASSQGLAFVSALFIGLGLGAEVDIMAFLISRYFGLKAFGAIYGLIFGVFGLAGGLGAYVMGASFDATGSYALMLAVFCAAASVGASLMLRLGPYRYGPGYAVERGPESDMVPI